MASELQTSTASPRVAARAAIVADSDWRAALDRALEQTAAKMEHGRVDLALLFASSAYSDEFTSLLARAVEAIGATVLVGCSGHGVIGPAQELEDVPSLSLLTLAQPGAQMWAHQFEQGELGTVSDWPSYLDIPPGAVHGWLVLADPFRLDCEALLARLQAAYPGKPLVGGLASGAPSVTRTHIFLDRQVFDEGAVGVALGGTLAVRTVVSQGAIPIGKPWTITGAHDYLIETIGNRPALDVLIETLEKLPPSVQERARRNLLVGLAMDEYRDAFGRGDFLVRNLAGVDRQSGAIAVGAQVLVGQTLQFQMRDAAAADEELNALLAEEAQQATNHQPLAALLCACNGRGEGMFGVPSHDARVVAEHLGPLPLAGFFCNGEIGPVGGKVFLHGFTASLALFVPSD